MGAFKRISFAPKSIRCYFHVLGCYEEFNITHEEEWVKHSLTHLIKARRGKDPVQVQPPKHWWCNFCGAEFGAVSGSFYWRERMRHVLHHHEDEYSLARTDWALVEYLWKEGLLRPGLYQELKPVRVSLPTSLSLDDEDDPMAIQKTYRYPTTPQKPPQYSSVSASASPSIYSLIEHPPNSTPAYAFPKAPSSPEFPFITTTPSLNATNVMEVYIDKPQEISDSTTAVAKKPSPKTSTAVSSSSHSPKPTRQKEEINLGS